MGCSNFLGKRVDSNRQGTMMAKAGMRGSL
jgi:hypothetical protein